MSPRFQVRPFIDTVVIPFAGDDCLKWPFHTRPDGRGEYKVDGCKQLAHRVVCEIAHGQAPTPQHHAAHCCGNGHLGCVNPRHLRWATKSENEKDRALHGTSNRGERHGQSKLSEADIIEIRENAGVVTQESLAARFGVSRRNIGRIQHRQRWGWLETEAA